MEVSRFDRVLQKLEARSERISDKIAKDLGKVKPFDKEPVTEREQLYNYSQLKPEALTMLRQQYGDRPVDAYVASMEQLRGKYA